MKRSVGIMARVSAIGAVIVMASFSARAEKYQVVSNLTNAVFSSSGKALQTVGNTPIDKVFARAETAALLGCAHSVDTRYLNSVSTNKYMGTWDGESQTGMLVRNIEVSDVRVVLIVEERFLIYTNVEPQNVRYYFSENSYKTIFTDHQSVGVEQDCNPPDPWTARGTWAPYCRDEMTNRTEVIDHYEGVTREVVGYYDADGDGYATLSRVGVVNGSKGDYLDELADGPYWIVNDVLITKYTIPRNSFLNWVYGTEDAQNHYWYAIKALYQITLETTPLRPWWQMTEYQ